jgi:hypothetical protein
MREFVVRKILHPWLFYGGGDGRMRNACRQGKSWADRDFRDPDFKNQYCFVCCGPHNQDL